MYWQMDSLPRNHQGSPQNYFKKIIQKNQITFTLSPDIFKKWDINGIDLIGMKIRDPEPHFLISLLAPSKEPLDIFKIFKLRLKVKHLDKS